MPEWLQRSRPAAGDPRTGQETDARQVFRRLAGCWTYWGWKGGYFSSEADALAVPRRDLPHAGGADGRPELAAVVQHRPALGLRHRGAAAGALLRRSGDGRGERSTSAYEHPAPHACFIQSVNDDLVNEGGIMDLWVREARIFKYGSGTGSNFSATARRGRAAVRRRQVERADELPQDRRPRRRGDQVGRHHAPRRQDGRPRPRPSGYRGVHQLEGGRGGEGRRPGAPARGCSTGTSTPSSRRATRWPKADGTLRPRTQHRPAQGHRRSPRRRWCRPTTSSASSSSPSRASPSLQFEEYDTDWNSKAYLHRLRPEQQQLGAHRQRLHGGGAQTTAPGTSTGAPRRRRPQREGRAPKPRKTLQARDLWDQIAYAAWSCADPGVQFDTTINEWHTCPADGRINASNPCSEYMFLDDTACNLASSQPAEVLRHRRPAASTSTPSATPAGCGR